MHKIHIVQRPDAEAALKKNFSNKDTVVVVSYTTHVEVANQSLLASIKSWWLARKLKVSVS